jgi:hypothetical protein
MAEWGVKILSNYTTPLDEDFQARKWQPACANTVCADKERVV